MKKIFFKSSIGDCEIPHSFSESNKIVKAIKNVNIFIASNYDREDNSSDVKNPLGSEIFKLSTLCMIRTNSSLLLFSFFQPCCEKNQTPSLENFLKSLKKFCQITFLIHPKRIIMSKNKCSCKTIKKTSIWIC